MEFNKEGKRHIPLLVEQINGRFILAVYQGSISQYDILIKYRQKENDKWSSIRTPKHIHWAVDMLIKMHEDRETTKRFLEFLMQLWNKIQPVRTDDERTKALSIESLLEENQKEILKLKN